MKVSIGSKIIDGPWGGGNLFVINLKNYLEKNGVEVVFSLKDKDIDIVLMTNPNKKSSSSSFSYKDVQRYKRSNKKAVIVHRINECDERKGTKNVNKFILKSNKVADFTIFVSNWLENLYQTIGLDGKNKKTILSGSDKEIFNNRNSADWNQNLPLKLVTHHWGNNLNKGFEIYSIIDNELDNPDFRKYFEFSYIGNLPDNFNFKNVKVFKPLSGLDLAEKIKEHHLYITGSINEPSGNHHIEGALCGLPVLYVNSGGIPEYTRGYGYEINSQDVIKMLYKSKENYSTLKQKMYTYPFNSEKMCEEYLQVFKMLMGYKNEN